MLENQIQTFESVSWREEILARCARNKILARNQTFPPSTLSTFLQFQKRYCWICGCLAPAEMAPDLLGE